MSELPYTKVEILRCRLLDHWLDVDCLEVPYILLHDVHAWMSGPVNDLINEIRVQLKDAVKDSEKIK